MFKLFLAVITGTILAWYVVFRLMTSTDHMPDTFTFDSTSYLEREARKASEATTSAEAEAEATPALVTAPSSAPPKDIQRASQSGQQRTIPKPKQEGLRITSKVIADEAAEPDALEPLNTVTALPVDDEADDAVAALALDEEQDPELIAVEGETQVAVRADSDVDIKTAEANAEKEQSNSAASQRERPRASVIKNESRELKKVEPIKALDIAYALPIKTDCVEPDKFYPQVSVLYRPKSFAIKGQSLSNIDQLIKLYRKCSGGKFIVLPNATDEKESDDKLNQLRQDEVKYYLLQRRIPKDDIILPEES